MFDGPQIPQPFVSRFADLADREMVGDVIFADNRRLLMAGMLNGSRDRGDAVALPHDTTPTVVYAGDVHAIGGRDLGDRRRNPAGVAEDLARVWVESGHRGMSHVAGEFCVAVWSASGRALTLVRDALGVMQVYYVLDRGVVTWASNLDHLLELRCGHLSVSDEFVYDFLNRIARFGQTPYEEVEAVYPAEALSFHVGGRRSRFRTWCIDATKTHEFKKDGEYIEGLSAELSKAVRRRVIGGGVVTAELSGGLDSSSIVCTANAVLRGAESEDSLQTVSRMYDNAPSADEREYMRSVEEAVGRRRYHVVLRDAPTLEPRAGTVVTVPCAEYVVRRMDEDIWAWMAQSGSHLLLSGRGGDHLMWSVIWYPPHLADYLRRGQLQLLHNGIMAWGKSLNRTYIDLLLNAGVRPLLPRQLQWGRTVDVKRNRFAHPRLRGPLKRDDIGRAIAKNYSNASPSARSRITMIAYAMTNFEDGHQQSQPILMSYPFLDRDFVEWCLAVPTDRLIRPEQTRWLHRRALRHYLTDSIANRTSKATTGEVKAWVVSRLCEECALLLRTSGLEAVRREYVDPLALEAALKGHVAVAEDQHQELLLVFMLEMWLRSVRSRSADASSATCSATLP